MQRAIDLVKQFCQKFRIVVPEKPVLLSPERSDLRYRLMREEVEEYLEWVQKWDIQNISKELADILSVVYGTILEHGLEDIIEPVFEEVCRSNQTEEYSTGKMLKGEGYEEADVGRFFDKNS